jgi:hypothetical protein
MADTRNVWHNPAHVNSMNNYVVTEWSNGTAAIAGVNTSGEAAIFRAGGNLNYGLSFGSDAHGQLAGVATANPARLDLFIGGSAGMDWGVRLGYDSYKLGDNGGSAFDLGFGANLSSGMSVWANIAPAASEKDATGTETKHDMGMSFGASMPLMGWTASLDYGSDKGAEGSDADDSTSLSIGMGKVMEAGSGARWFTDVSLDRSTVGDDATRLSVPVTFGFEADANSWLTWRGSASQSVFGEADNGTTKSSASTFAVNAGATLNFGKLKVDGTVGATDAVDANTFLAGIDAHYWF